jgi:hypothetical protein
MTLMTPLITALSLPLVGSASPVDASFHLDGLSVIHEIGTDEEAVYSFPQGARFRVQFRDRSGDQIPVVVPTEGLDLGVLRSPGAPPLRITLTGAGTGSVRITGTGSGVLELNLPVVVKRVGAKRGSPYQVRLTSPVHGPATAGPAEAGRAEFVVSGDVDNRGGPARTYYAVISGSFDRLPDGLR